ncbi:hypothetical protein BC629DRAFT_892296 [Irpex lacteus]|nr:hypothetical protein BC629DRAFT_892296 [Irpex lacteus]
MQTTPKKTERFDTLEVKHEVELSKTPSPQQPKIPTSITTKLVSEQTLLEIRRKKESRKELRERAKEKAVRETMEDGAASGHVQSTETENVQARPVLERETTGDELRSGWTSMVPDLNQRFEAGRRVAEDNAVKPSREYDRIVGDSVLVKATTSSTEQRLDKERKPAVKMPDKELHEESDKESDKESANEESNEESGEKSNGETDEERAQQNVSEKRDSTSADLEARLNANTPFTAPPVLRPHDKQRLPNIAGVRPGNTSAMPALTRAFLKAPASATTMKDVKDQSFPPPSVWDNFVSRRTQLLQEAIRDSVGTGTFHDVELYAYSRRSKLVRSAHFPAVVHARTSFLEAPSSVLKGIDFSTS